jgi:trk system potassium uptake protein TrkH
VGVFFYLMFIGGCTGSTSGAIKIFRFRVLLIVLAEHTYRRFRPHALVRRVYDGRPLTGDVVEGVMAFLALYFLTVALIAVALAALGLDWLTALSGSVQAMGNIGPGLGPIIGPAGNFASLPDAAKWMLALGMLLGRLELFTVLVLLVPAFWRQ